MQNKKRWLFITAGLGSENFQDAALRLVKQAESFEVFDHCHAVLNDEILDICPKIADWHSWDELMNLKGFGWYVWKSSIGLAALQGRWGDFDGVMYLDSGCEMFLSGASRKRLLKYIENAELNGATLFTIPTPEYLFTKRLLFESFELTDEMKNSNQFQSGSWLMYGAKGKEILQVWNDYVWKNPYFTDESQSPNGEDARFIINRYDQSVFSLVVKILGHESIREMPPGGNVRFRAKIRGFIFPFWWSRNRNGSSTIPRYFRIIGILTLKISLALSRFLKNP